MTKFLRTVSTRRLLALIVGLITAIAAGTAIAIAAAGTGPVPAKRPLADAIHTAIGARQVPGITARISFTNHLIASSNIQGSDPILTGATGRLWLSNQSPAAPGAPVRQRRRPGRGQQRARSGSMTPRPTPSTRASSPAAASAPRSGTATPSPRSPNPARHQPASPPPEPVGGDSSDVAGQAAYTVRVSPKHDGGLLGDTEIAWDAARGVPLRFASTPGARARRCSN